MTGTELITAERQRQITAEGYTAEHDEGHADELAHAAACYALAEYRRDSEVDGPTLRRIRVTASPPHWPWDNEWWKPTPDDRIRELVKAGALIAAAIDSLRAEGEPS